MNKMMKAAVFIQPGRIELVDKPIPDVGPNDALVRITTTTLCGTDVHILKGEYPVAPGLTVGHEPVGIIGEEQGPADGGAIQLHLGKAPVLEPLDQQQIQGARIEAGQQRLEGGLPLRGLPDQGVAPVGGRHHLGGARLAQAVAVLAGLVHVKGVMGVLEHPEAQTARHQARDEALQQGGLAGAAPGDEAEQGQGAHGRSEEHTS